MGIEKKQKIDLIAPVEFEGQAHSSIEIRRIKAKDLRGMRTDSNDLDDTLDLIVKLSGWPPEGVDELDQADIENIGDVIQGFTKKRRR